MWLVEMLLGHTFVLCILTLQCWRPPQSFACGCLGSASCSQRTQGKNCAPGHKTPCHYSSWMRSSGYPHAGKTNRIKMEAVIDNDGNIPKSRSVLMMRWALSCGCLTHLIWASLGTAPVEQHLLNGVCIGYTKAGGTLNLVYLGNRLISRAKKNVGFVLIFTCFDLLLVFLW